MSAPHDVTPLGDKDLAGPQPESLRASVPWSRDPCEVGSCAAGACASALSTEAPAEAPAESSGTRCHELEAERERLRLKRDTSSPNTKASGDFPQLPFTACAAYPQGLFVGMDIGSTTVKAVVVDPEHDRILWQDYRRHETKQLVVAHEFLARILASFPEAPESAFRLFVTGSGGQNLVLRIGGKFVQEVTSVSLAVEKLYPQVQSVVELGGQDAKIIIFKDVDKNGKKKKIPTMNDKCAGGTGAVIDKINAKVKIPAEKLKDMGFAGLRVHPVAGKCGVFAETDINGLQKQGVPADELMASLFESLVQQNLSVLTRGHTLKPYVLLLGGPNTFIRGMQECWRAHLPQVWKERKVALPNESDAPESFVIVPDNAQYFAALGAIEFGRQELLDSASAGTHRGRAALSWYLEAGRARGLSSSGGGLAKDADELAAFLEEYRPKPWHAARFEPGSVLEAFLGVDGGSTSTKGVLLSRDAVVLAKAYQLSKGNPIEDTQEIIALLDAQVRDQGATLKVLGVGTTGYAKDILKDVLGADVALVETVAHTQAGLHFFPDTDVIVDVGGQDIKLIVLRDGRVKDFKLNTQCSAGNGYFLQSTAKDFGFEVAEYAEVAFRAQRMPQFGYGCAVFMQSDIVDFQRQGWAAEEILAGLAAVLPKNIWLYVSQIANLPGLGRRFLLQGGTQHNLAAVKSQRDFIRSRFVGVEAQPEVIVHPHCGESGAIGAALEARRLVTAEHRVTGFIGLERVQQITYQSTRDERTRCFFCKNHCLRTFIDVITGQRSAGPLSRSIAVPDTEGLASREEALVAARHSEEEAKPRIDYEAHTLKSGPDGGRPSRITHAEKPGSPSKLPLPAGSERIIIATCEKGTVEDVDDMKEIKSGLDQVKKDHPNFMDLAAAWVFEEPKVDHVADAAPGLPWWPSALQKKAKVRRALMARRKAVRIGIPRVLNAYSQAPFFLGFFKALGVPFANIAWSSFTDEEMYKKGAKRGAIDPCFPSKLGIPHVHDLLMRVHPKKPLTHVFFPMVDSFPSFLEHTVANRACPTTVGSSDATHAAFIKEGDLFAERGIVFKKTFIVLDEPQLAARQLHADWRDELGLSFEETLRAVRQGLGALDAYHERLRREADRVLSRLEREGSLGIVALGRPYHNDPGVHHGIPEELQKCGYPIFTIESLPRDAARLDRLFGREVEQGFMASALSVDDVWKNSYSENSSRKVWAAKYAARHPNLVALELSSFKCGHDAPIYAVIEGIIERSGTPYFCFKDIDENRPAGSIAIRVQTIDYFLKRYQADQRAGHQRRQALESRLKGPGAGTAAAEKPTERALEASSAAG